MDTSRRAVVKHQNRIVVWRDPGITEIGRSVRAVPPSNVRVELWVVKREARSFEDDDKCRPYGQLVDTAPLESIFRPMLTEDDHVATGETALSEIIEFGKEPRRQDPVVLAGTFANVLDDPSVSGFQQ